MDQFNGGGSVPRHSDNCDRMKDQSMRLGKRRTNLISGRQLRAARALAGLSQKALGEAVGVSERAVRGWEARGDNRPVGAPNDVRVEQALRGLGIEVFSDPWPGVLLFK